MEEITVTLKSGLMLGGRSQTEAVLRESTVGDLVAAYEETDSDAIAGFLIIAAQIVRIGEIEGPLDREMLGGLTAADMARLEKAVAELDARGREDGPEPQSGD